MRLIKLERFEIYDGIHEFGSVANVYYIEGKGIIDSRGNFSEDIARIKEIEEYLKNPVNRKKEHMYEGTNGEYVRLVGKAEVSDEHIQQFLDIEIKRRKLNRERKIILKSLTDRVVEE